MAKIQHCNLNFKDRRKHLRFNCNIVGTINLGATHITKCIIKDISAGGARIVVLGDSWLPSKFTLEFSDKCPALIAEKVWFDSYSAGVRFAN